MNATHCECDTDGFCNRYQREMRGRWREICRGINVDLGTSTAYRMQWAREAKACHLPEKNLQPQALRLITNQAPGDTLVLTAAIYSLHKAYPGKYLTSVESNYPEIFENNPGTARVSDDATEIQMHYPAIHESNDRGIHFMQGYCEFLGAVLGIHVPLMTNRPHLFFREIAPSIEDFWVVCSGTKSDMTTKQWGGYQEVVDRLEGKVNFVQVGAKHKDHPLLFLHKGSRDLVEKTTLRELFDLVRRCRGVLCGVSLLMHVAAALEKPAIIIAGGREPVQWNSYPQQHYLHTIGMLPCKSYRGRVREACWRSHISSSEDSNVTSLCERPINNLPECMRLIEPKDVAQLTLKLDAMYNM